MPALIAGAMLGGSALQFGGNLMQSRAGTSIKTRRRRGRYAIQQARAQDAVFGGLEESALKSAHAKELGGYTGARKGLELGATAARQGVLGRGKMAQADLEQSIVSKGLLGTTSGLGRLSQLQDRTSAQMSAIDMQLAQQLADLGLEESETMGRQGRELTGLAGKRRAFEKELGEAEYSLLTL